MNMWKKIIVILVLLGLASCLYVYFFVVNKSHPDYAKEKPVFVLQANQLFNDYKTNKQSADNKYNGKVIEISGIFSKVEKNDSLCIVVFTFSQGDFGDEGIRCTMLRSYHEKAKALKENSEIKIKGFCTGYNETDVILEKCSIN